jgi:16S rRNA (uracil1498-N3)-methyltransferase
MGKGDRMDWIVQKATELGVAVITPLTSEHAEVRLAPERALKKQVHWQEVALNACEQCGRGDLPDIRTPQPLQDWLDQASGQKLVLHTEGQRQRLSDVSTDQPCHLLVGPEGGFSVREVRAALSAGFTAISLGPRVLRMETAAIAATAVLQWLASDST